MADGDLSPNPRPIPIIVGMRSKDILYVPWVRIVIRVIEHGWPDVWSQQILRGDVLLDHLSMIVDRMVESMVKEVGRRHGIWVCHVLPESFEGYFPGENLVQVPQISERIYALAEMGATSMPLIMWDEAMEGWSNKDIIRAYARPEDLRAATEGGK